MVASFDSTQHSISFSQKKSEIWDDQINNIWICRKLNLHYVLVSLYRVGDQNVFTDTKLPKTFQWPKRDILLINLSIIWLIILDRISLVWWSANVFLYFIQDVIYYNIVHVCVFFVFTYWKHILVSICKIDTKI